LSHRYFYGGSNKFSGNPPPFSADVYVSLDDNCFTNCSVFRRADSCPCSTPEVDPAVRAAMVDLYTATGGADWFSNTKWNTAAPVCDWDYVECTGAMPNHITYAAVAFAHRA
jgi:hypothetical protein